jgi:hypothetical protein
MKPGITGKSVVLAFVIVLALYLVVFHGIEHLRQRHGPWTARFRTDGRGEPMLVVTQDYLHLSDVKLVFHGEQTTNAPADVRFDRVKQPVPFGTVIYEDLTFLPGVVTFDLFGHEIELLPRALIVNKKIVPWRSGATIELWPTNKPAVPPKPPRGH